MGALGLRCKAKASLSHSKRGTPIWRLAFPEILFGFVGEGEFGFFVEDQGTKERVGGASAGDVDGYGENAGYALLEVVDVGGRRRWRGSVFVFLFLAARDLRRFRVEGYGLRSHLDSLVEGADVEADLIGVGIGCVIGDCGTHGLKARGVGGELIGAGGYVRQEPATVGTGGGAPGGVRCDVLRFDDGGGDGGAGG